MMIRIHTITKKHYIPESTFIYQKALRKHMQGGGLYALWITILYVLDNKILERDQQMIIELLIYVQIISCKCFIKKPFYE